MALAAGALVLAAVNDAALAQMPLRVRGLVDVVAVGQDNLRYENTTNFQDSGFDLVRTRVFVEGASGRTQAFVQILVSDASISPVRLYGAYLLHQPFASRELYLEGGRIPTHDGAWATRVYSSKNPLIGVPLAYYWKMSLTSKMLPVDLDALLAQKGNGQTGVYYTDAQGKARGAPYAAVTTIYDSCWNHGVYVLGTEGKIEYSAGVTVGPPAAPVAGPDTNEDLSLHAKLGCAFLSGLKASVAYAQGAYLARDVQPYLPAGGSVDHYLQRLWIGSAEASFGHLTLNGEVFVNHFETPLRADGLGNTAFYVDGTYDFLPGWYVALRYDDLRFSKVPEKGDVTWDQNVRRIEGGIGYHASRELVLKAVVQATDDAGKFTREYVLPALQASFSF
jgi:hypothetical protein